MQPIVLVTDPEGLVEAFSSMQFAIEENNFDHGNYRFAIAESAMDLHIDSARGATLGEVYLATRFVPERSAQMCNHWCKNNQAVLVWQEGNSEERYLMTFTYLYV